MNNLKKYSYNELKDFFNEYREEWTPTSLLPLTAGINPDEKLYTDFQFKKLKEFFLGSRLDNFLCKRINCFDINLNHTHSEPETQEEYRTRAIILLEEWKDYNSERKPTDPRGLEIYQREMEKLSWIIALWKEERDFEEQVAKLSDYFDNNRINAISKKLQLFELEERCKELIKNRNQKNTKIPDSSESWIKKILTSPWTWLVMIVIIIGLVYWLVKRKFGLFSKKRC